ESLGMRVPELSLVRFAADVESVDRNDELADLLRGSEGVNLGFAYLEGAANLSPASELDRVGPNEAAAILWLDGLVMNPDRTARNPNLLWWRDELWLIDHGAALGFQYALPDVDPAAARRPSALRQPHLLQSRVAVGVDGEAGLSHRPLVRLRSRGSAILHGDLPALPHNDDHALLRRLGVERLEYGRKVGCDVEVERLCSARGMPDERRRHNLGAF